LTGASGTRRAWLSPPVRKAAINHFQGLSFRYYGLNGIVPTAYAEGGLMPPVGKVRTK